jgi:hypothetical protein
MKDHWVNRRDFLKAGVGGLGGYVFIAQNEKGQEEKIEERGGKKRKFVYRTLGKTGVKLPIISMGAIYAGAPTIIRSAMDAGIIHIETAHAYVRGKNEEVIGEAVKGRPRDSFLISTKAHFMSDRLTFLYTRPITPEAVQKFLDESLKRLKLEYVDFLYHHDVARKESALHEPILRGMEKAKKDGKARFLGLSTHRNEPEVILTAAQSNFYEVIQTSYNFKQKHYLEVRAAIAKAAQAGLGIVAMKTMGGGWGNQDPLNPVNARAALKWVLQDPNVSTTVPGFCTFEEMETDLAVMEDLAMDDSDKKWLQKQASLPGLYCQQCGQCMKQCIAKIPIPDLMRAYMYAYGYRNLKMTRDLVVSLGLPRKICDDCGSCPVKCAIGFNVPAKIRDVVRVRDIPAEFLL